MLRKGFLLSILIPICCCSMQFAQTIYRPSYKQITWTNFKGICEDCEDKVFAAYSALKLNVVPMNCSSDTCYLSVCAGFFDNTAWADPKDTNAYLLNHEQRHFDIYEIGARLIRRSMEKKQYKKYSNWLFDAFEMIDQMYIDFVHPTTNLYDSQTNHSANIEQQKVWNDKIQAGLDSLGMYSNEVMMKRVESQY